MHFFIYLLVGKLGHRFETCLFKNVVKIKFKYKNFLFFILFFFFKFKKKIKSCYFFWPFNYLFRLFTKISSYKILEC